MMRARTIQGFLALAAGLLTLLVSCAGSKEGAAGGGGGDTALFVAAADNPGIAGVSMTVEEFDGGGGVLSFDDEEEEEETISGGVFSFEDEDSDDYDEGAGLDSAPMLGLGAVTAEAARSRANAPAKKKRVKTWRRSRILPNASRLTVGEGDELPLKGMQASVRIDGFRARVYLDLYFLNDRDAQLEGTFTLRLPNEASPHFLAFGSTAFAAAELPGKGFLSTAQIQRQGASPNAVLEVRAQTWTQPKVARVVPKEKAAFAYRQTVRRRVDPALMEWSGAGMFRTRVFPLEPGKLHRITLGYDVDLLAVGDDFVYRLDLPAVPSCVVDLDVDASTTAVVMKPTTKPVSAISGPMSVAEPDDPTQAAAEGRGASIRRLYRLTNPTDRRVEVRLTGAASQRRGSLLTHTSADASADAAAVGDGEAYVTASFVPTLPKAAASSAAAKGLFLLDVSLSSNPDRINVWLELIESVLKSNRDALREFAVLCFGVEQFWWRPDWSENSEEDLEALKAFVNTLALEGATDLGAALSVAAQPRWDKDPSAPRDLFLLSDGATTWGDADPYALSKRLGGAALFAYRTGLPGTATGVLRHLARESGGAVFSVVGAAEVEAASTAHRLRPWRLLKVEVPGCSDVLLAGRPTSVFSGQRLKLAARGVPERPVVLLTLRQGSADPRTFEVPLAKAVASPLTARAYGEVATGQLEELSALTEETSAAYARHFRVPGRTCSLLMLETEEDYQRFGIKPEEDALVVKTNPASAVVAEALAELGETLGDPKASFLAFVKKLEALPGLELKLKLAVRQALERLPSEAFAVNPPALTCDLRTRDGIPGPLSEQLDSKELDYDAFSEEARRRLHRSPADALKAISSLVESRPGDTVLARDVGFSAMQWGLGAQAYTLFRRVARQRPYEPQTYGAMAQCLEALGDTDLALAWYEVGLAGAWDARFGAFRQIHGLSYLRFLRKIAAGELETALPDLAAARLKTVAREFDLGSPDLVVTITWNTDGTDVDLHVTEPTGEECFYSHPDTELGGHLTQDVTNGFGPEMYTLKRAEPGAYTIRAKYFSDDANRTRTRTKVFATVVRGWGTPRERVTKKVLTLQSGKEMHQVAVIKVP